MARTTIWCLVCGETGLTDVVQNIIFFTPLGLGLGLLGWRPGGAAIAGFLVSLVVESLQFALVAGRDPSLSDLVTNTTGSALGAWFAAAFLGPAGPDAALARRLAWTAAAAVPALWALGAWALQPDALPGPWQARLRAELPTRDPYRGEIAEAAVNATRIAPDGGTIMGDAAARLARDGIEVRVRLVNVPPPAGSESILWLGTADSTGQLDLARKDARVSFGVRTNSARVRMRAPELLVARVLPGGERDVTLTARYRRDGIALRVDAPGATPREDAQALGPHALASLLTPLPVIAHPGWVVVAFGWVGGLVALLLAAALVGWTGTAGWRRGLAAVAVGAAVLPVVNRLGGFPPVPAAGWAVLGAGLALGAGAGMLLRRPDRRAAQ